MNQATAKFEPQSSKYIWAWCEHFGTHPLILDTESGWAMPMTHSKQSKSQGFKLHGFKYGKFSPAAAPCYLKKKYASKNWEKKSDASWKQLSAKFDAQLDEAFAPYL